MKTWFKIFIIGWLSCFIPWGPVGMAAGFIPVLLASTLVYFLVFNNYSL